MSLWKLWVVFFSCNLSAQGFYRGPGGLVPSSFWLTLKLPPHPSSSHTKACAWAVPQPNIPSFSELWQPLCPQNLTKGQPMRERRPPGLGPCP